jgi:hypothetical protein
MKEMQKSLIFSHFKLSLKKAPFLELFISSFKEIFPGKFKHAISLPTKLPTK